MKKVFSFFSSLTLIHFFGHGLGEGLSTVLICLLHLPLGFPGGLVVKNLPANAGDAGLISGSGRSPVERSGSSILAWKSHEQRSLAGYSPWGHKRVRYDLVTAQQQHLFLNTCQYTFFFFFLNKASGIPGLPW